MSLISKFKKFALHYATEVGTIAKAVSMLLANLPVPRAEKDEIERAVASLLDVGERIEAGLVGLADVTALNATDRKALAKDVAALLKPDLEKLIADQATAAAVDATTKALDKAASDALDKARTETTE